MRFFLALILISTAFSQVARASSNKLYSCANGLEHLSFLKNYPWPEKIDSINGVYTISTELIEKCQFLFFKNGHIEKTEVETEFDRTWKLKLQDGKTEIWVYAGPSECSVVDPKDTVFIPYNRDFGGTRVEQSREAENIFAKNIRNGLMNFVKAVVLKNDTSWSVADQQKNFTELSGALKKCEGIKALSQDIERLNTEMIQKGFTAPSATGEVSPAAKRED